MSGAPGTDAVPPADSDEYRAGFLAGHAVRQVEVDALEYLADRLYRAAYDDERRIRGNHVTRAELEQRRQITEPPAKVTTAAALASWGITPTDAATTNLGASTGGVDVAPAVPEQAGRPARTSRKRIMGNSRTITGRLATDPEQVQAGRVQIVKLRVIENTGEYRKDEWVPHDDPTTHFVETKFQLATNVLESLRKGDAVIVTGQEHTVSWGTDTNKRYGRVVHADHIGIDLTRHTAQIGREQSAAPSVGGEAN